MEENSGLGHIKLENKEILGSPFKASGQPGFFNSINHNNSLDYNNNTFQFAHHHQHHNYLNQQINGGLLQHMKDMNGNASKKMYTNNDYEEFKLLNHQHLNQAGPKHSWVLNFAF